ncbi:putative AlkP superfamily pyrophosphatase or phosphodiesterase [Paenibacillus taihuensis]|uniref:Putative AlkP superfamily pyrophosphatase or phosphodiesterase n=1 Tax=Paenibacillus taihuensis TaxID=1156355 RepID=A0A3D9S3M0_9BACL|nr:alkaline phosphatase family protein [Paenibacillus taihuensis]REE83906.1 putative AlkP superfamily pyrophosphatase or phosphodiesterase [Paenibacillus taihuensis]
MNRRVIIIGTDGLRPDCIDLSRMPTYAALIREGALFSSFHSSYPSETRVSMTTLTTGTLPGRHGVVGNLMVIPGFRHDGFLQTGDDRDLLAYKCAMSEPFILDPTLGDRLGAHGLKLAVAASSSPGASLLWNLNHPEQVINPSSIYESEQLQQLHKELGAVPAELSHIRRERALWATRALTEVHLQNPANGAMVLWLSEPDSAQHDYGLGSPENLEALELIDGCVAEVLRAIDEKGLRDEVDLFLISDHGHSTIQAQGSLQEHVRKACDELELAQRFVAAGHYVYAAPQEAVTPSLQETASLIDWVQQQPWCERVYVGSSDLCDLPGVLPMEQLVGPITHRRAPLFAVQPIWSGEQNEYGVPGTTLSLTSSSMLRASHGTANPYDRHAFCLAVGSSFRQGFISDVPCGIQDIAPTVCWLVGLRDETGFDGRVLSEAFKLE